MPSAGTFSLDATGETHPNTCSILASMTRADDADRLTVATLTGIAGRHAGLMVGNGAGDESTAVAELRRVANGRPDLLARVAAAASRVTDESIPHYAEQHRMIARLCERASEA
jgi:hypothetical protein